MYLELLPSIVGLALTPAAVAGCILLLQSDHPLPNALSFAAAFLVSYGALSVIVLAIGTTVEPTDDTTSARAVVSITVGALFLLLGLVMLTHHPRHPDEPPHWVGLLARCTPPTAFLAGGILAVANPNLFLLLSGLGVVATATDTAGAALLGAAALLGGVAVDLVVPIGLFLVFGASMRARLDAARRWMVAHDRQLSLVILFGFGGLFAAKGLVTLL